MAADPLPALAMVRMGTWLPCFLGNSWLTMGCVMPWGRFREGLRRTWNFGSVPILMTLLLDRCVDMATLGRTTLTFVMLRLMIRVVWVVS